MEYSQDWTDGYNAAVTDALGALGNLERRKQTKHATELSRLDSVLALIEYAPNGRTHKEYKQLAQDKGICRHASFNLIWVTLQKRGLIRRVGKPISSRNVRWVRTFVDQTHLLDSSESSPLAEAV